MIIYQNKSITDFETEIERIKKEFELAKSKYDWKFVDFRESFSSTENYYILNEVVGRIMSYDGQKNEIEIKYISNGEVNILSNLLLLLKNVK